MFLEILVIIGLVLLNGFLAMSEMAIITARKTRLQVLADKGDRAAKAALLLADKPEDFLSSVQIGITLVGIIAGVYGGATIADRLGVYLQRLAFINPHGETIAVIIVVGVITYLSLLLGELVPKRIALSSPEKIAAQTASIMRFFKQLTYPLVRLLTASTNAVLELFRVPPPAPAEVTEAEVKELIEQGTQTGVFEEAEQDMVESVLTLGNKPISALMTPRTEIVWHDLDDSLQTFHNKIKDNSRSVFPVGQGSLDNVLGVVHARDYLTHTLTDTKDQGNITDLVQDALFVVESTPVLKVVEMFKHSGIQIAFVIDEHGVVQGLVTITDVLEAIIGSMNLPHEPEAFQRGDGSWLIGGMYALDEFKRLFNMETWPGEEQGHYHTMGGLLVVHMGRIPRVGDTLTWNNFTFEVIDMDGRRVDKILVTGPANL